VHLDRGLGETGPPTCDGSDLARQGWGWAGYTAGMTVPADQAGRRVARPERTPAAIRAELPADLRAKFDAEYQAALDDAKSTYRLDRLNEAIEGWWLTVWSRRSPRHEQAMETGRRILRGEPVATYPYEPEPHGR
jgi:hypothetical protein